MYLLLKIMSLFKGGRYFVRAGSSQWPVGYSNWKYLYKEIFLKEIYSFSTDKKNPTILDCGSNVGFSLLYFKNRYPMSSVKCFEANPEMFKVLQVTQEKNNLVSIELHNKALTSDGSGFVQFFVGDEGASLGSSIFRREGLKRSVNVQSTKLSDQIEQEVDFLKLDVEGAEYGIFEDLISTGKIRFIKEAVVEIHKLAIGDHETLIKKLSLYKKIEVIEDSSDAVVVRLKNF